MSILRLFLTQVWHKRRLVRRSLIVAVIAELTYDAVMKKYLLLLLIASVVAQADIYRIVDEYGNVIYSDQADNSAEKVELQEPSMYTPTPIPVEIKEVKVIDEQEELDVPDYKLTITSPVHDENIWGNAATTTINVDITPELNFERGDQLIFKLDGKQVGSPQSSTSFTLENLDRGSHIAVVTVVDKAGEIIRSSKSVLFHIHRRSQKVTNLPTN